MFFIASAGGFKPIVETLLNNRAEIDMKSIKGETSLHLG